MKSTKKLVALILVAVMLIAALAACADADTPSAPPTAAPPDTSGTPTDTGEDPGDASGDDFGGLRPFTYNDEFPGEVGLAKYNEPLTVSMSLHLNENVTFPPGQDWDSNIWRTHQEEMLNILIDVVWTAEGLDNYNQRVNLSIVSGDLPDVMAVEPPQFEALSRAGLAQDMTWALETYASEFLRDQISYPDAIEAFRQSTINGMLLGIPRANAGFGRHHFVFIREDWRRNLDMPEPRTMADLRELAHAFTFNDPAGDGRTTYGLGVGSSLISTYMSINGFANAFGAFPRSWIDRDGQIVNGSIQPEMANALAELNRWYNEGIMDPEFIADDNFAASQKLIAGRNGIAFAEWWLATWPLPDAYQNGDEWRGYIIPFDESAPERRVRVANRVGSRYVVNPNMEEPGAIIKLLNLYQQRTLHPEADLNHWKGDGEYNFSQFAAITGDHGSDKNHEIYLAVTAAIDNDDLSFLTTTEMVQVHSYIEAYISGSPTWEENPQAFATNRLFYNINYGPNSIYALLDYMATNNMLKVDPFNGTLTDAMMTREVSLNDLENQVFTAIITGIEPLSYFDTFVEMWLEEGGAEMTAEVNEWAAYFRR